MDHNRTLQIEEQDFYKIREECLANQHTRRLWEDPLFEAADGTIFLNQALNVEIQWMRPKDIAPKKDPCFIVEGATRFDVQQGELGDCWMLAAVATLTLQPTLLSRVVPDDQSFGDKYAGIFHFRFWQYGRWLDVVVDDRLPTSAGKLVFLRSGKDNEFWSALLEKAYAKLHGSYKALTGGNPSEAMVDFTGGISEVHFLKKLKEPSTKLFNILLKAYDRNSLMCCLTGLAPEGTPSEGQRTSEGLVLEHVFSITGVRSVNTPTLQDDTHPLLRLRNPWGLLEWNGPWKDSCEKWKFISEEDRKEMGLVNDVDGEFWMSFDDFLNHFERLEICNLMEDELSPFGKKRWETSVCEGEWLPGKTDEQRYSFSISSNVEGGDKETITVGLIQKKRLGRDLLQIGFLLCMIKDDKPEPIYQPSSARNMRDESMEFHLTPGDYCIIPFTKNPDKEGEFLLRVFSEKKIHMNKVQMGDFNLLARAVKNKFPNGSYIPERRPT